MQKRPKRNIIVVTSVIVVDGKVGESEKGGDPYGGRIAEAREEAFSLEMEDSFFLSDVVDFPSLALIASSKRIRVVGGNEANGVTNRGSLMG